MSLSTEALALCEMSRPELAKRFRRGVLVDPQAIVGYRYRGVSLGLPTWVERLSWKKFAKTFYQHESGKVRGFNLRIRQDGLAQPWQVLNKDGSPWSFGPFEVAEERGTGHMELHYGRGSQGLSPLRRLRDPLRMLDGRGDVLLGSSLIDMGFGRRLATPSWFLLERDGAV
jgi:hypothetical protein